MDKSSKKSEPRDPQKTAAVKWTAQKFKVSNAYVYGIISPSVQTFVGGQAEEIKKAYNKKYNQLKAVLS